MRFLCPFPRLDGACLGTVGHRPDPVGFAKKCSKEVYNILKHSEIDQFSHQEWFSEELDKGQPSQRSKIRLSPTVLELLVFKHSWQNFAAPKKGTHTITHTHTFHMISSLFNHSFPTLTYEKGTAFPGWTSRSPLHSPIESVRALRSVRSIREPRSIGFSGSSVHARGVFLVLSGIVVRRRFYQILFHGFMV